MKKSGIKYSDTVLFQNKVCFVCTDHENKYYQIIADFWKNIKMKVTPITAKLHDEALANSSHLPHLLSTLLAKVNFDYKDQQQKKLPIYGSGFFRYDTIGKRS